MRKDWLLLLSIIVLQFLLLSGCKPRSGPVGQGNGPTVFRIYIDPALFGYLNGVPRPDNNQTWFPDIADCFYRAGLNEHVGWFDNSIPYANGMVPNIVFVDQPIEHPKSNEVNVFANPNYNAENYEYLGTSNLSDNSVTMYTAMHNHAFNFDSGSYVEQIDNAYVRNRIMARNIAHEIGHILLDEGNGAHVEDDATLMHMVLYHRQRTDGNEIYKSTTQMVYIRAEKRYHPNEPSGYNMPEFTPAQAEKLRRRFGY